MSSETSTPPSVSRSSSQSIRGPKTPLALDLSDLPPLIQPSPPSNTLLITNLHEPSIFHPANLLTIRDLINTTAPIHTWAPLRSFRRIVVSFYSVDSAILIKNKIDGESLMGDRVRVYFGEPTPIEPVDQHLQAPKSDKLFFISPPPSPPHGWEMRNEEPPNKDVHADDLATALAKLHAKQRDPVSPTSPVEMTTETPGREVGVRRQRSGSTTIVYDPEHHGNSPNLPAIAVEDTTDSPGDLTPVEGVEKPRLFHTARPPVELMTDN